MTENVIRTEQISFYLFVCEVQQGPSLVSINFQVTILAIWLVDVARLSRDSWLDGFPVITTFIMNDDIGKFGCG